MLGSTFWWLQYNHCAIYCNKVQLAIVQLMNKFSTQWSKWVQSLMKPCLDITSCACKSLANYCCQCNRSASALHLPSPPQPTCTASPLTKTAIYLFAALCFCLIAFFWPRLYLTCFCHHFSVNLSAFCPWLWECLISCLPMRRLNVFHLKYVVLHLNPYHQLWQYKLVINGSSSQSSSCSLTWPVWEIFSALRSWHLQWQRQDGLPLPMDKPSLCSPTNSYCVSLPRQSWASCQNTLQETLRHAELKPTPGMDNRAAVEVEYVPVLQHKKLHSTGSGVQPVVYLLRQV